MAKISLSPTMSHRLRSLTSRVLRSVILNCTKRIGILLLFIVLGCSVMKPPVDYYGKALEIEASTSNASQSPQQRANTELPTALSETKIVRMEPTEPPRRELITKPLTIKDEEKPNSKEVQQVTKWEETYSSSNNAYIPTTSEPIMISSVVIKSALEIADINVKSVELSNGRLTGGKNSVKVSFICESKNSIYEKFFTTCAVIYHLDKSKTVDTVIALAEDSQSNIIGVLQSDIEDISAWMNNLITRAEWLSRINKKLM